MGKLSCRLASAAGDFDAIPFLSPIAKREVEAIAFGLLARPEGARVVTHAEVLGAAGPGADLLHEWAQFPLCVEPAGESQDCRRAGR